MGDSTTAFDAIVSTAIEISSPEERAAYIRSRCGDDEPLKLRIQQLVDAHFRAGEFLESPVVSKFVKFPDTEGITGQFVPLSEGPRSMIGRYRLLEQIGEGGFGVVFMAEQEEPVRRMVALKIIKLGMDTRQVVARFEAERQALALMDHPGVAKVLDGGATDTGRPYFVMELVKGMPITEYCDKHNLNIARRLELFAQVCGAVQHAHQKGLIHRDIKPGNVLVSTQDDRPVAKVIDFGVAKAMQARLTEKTLFTEFQQLVGTPAYMSPEQAEGSLDIDTRSDVYSLGVLLYELLAGAPPFDPKELRSKAFAELQRIIREVEPPTPSTRLSSLHERLPTIAAHRAIEPRKLAALLRGELDWIVMRCLEKDRRRRFESAAALASDVIRYLADEPVTARPATRMYRINKFARRNKLPVIAAAAILAALIAGVTGTTIGLIGESRQRVIAEAQRAKAQRQEEEAKRQAEIAVAVNKFLVEVLASAHPQNLGKNATVLEAVRAAQKTLDSGALKDMPLVEASVRRAMGVSFGGLGQYEAAATNYRRAVELCREELPPTHSEIAWNLNELASTLLYLGRLDEAEPLFRETLAIRRETLPAGDPNLATSLNRLAMLLMTRGQIAEAEALYREAMTIDEKRPADDPERIETSLNLAIMLANNGKLSESEATLQKALAFCRESLLPKHPKITKTLTILAAVLHQQGRDDEAEPLYRESLAILRDTLPAGHVDIATCLGHLGLCLLVSGKTEEAEVNFREALQIMREGLPPGHPEIATCLHNIALVLQDQQKLAEAEKFIRESCDILAAALPSTHPNLAAGKGVLGTLLSDQGKLAEAEPIFREVLAAYEASFGQKHARVGDARYKLGVVLAALNRFADAESQLLEAQQVLASAENAAASYQNEQCIAALVSLYTDWDKSEPGKGYDTKAKQWHSKLPEKQAARPLDAPQPESDAPKP